MAWNSPYMCRRGSSHLLDKLFTAPVNDQFNNAQNLEAMTLREFFQFRYPGHGSVFVHDLADYSSECHSHHPAQINDRFGVARAGQYAAGIVS